MKSYGANPKWVDSFWVDLLAVWLVFFLYAGNQVPDVNESHYWTKAAHYWNPSFAAGDLFLESGDVHWAFYLVFGSLTQWLTLPHAVWCGRFITWTILAIGWTFMLHSIYERKGIPRVPMTATMIAVLWLAGMEWGLWAGEWVVGGCESKGIAYAMLIFGLAFLSRGSNTIGWLFLGVGCTFHVVAGMWVALTAGVALFLWKCLIDKDSIPQFIKQNGLGWTLCIVGFLAGAVPAILMDINTSRDQATESAVQQVYTRLGHHLSPIKFHWSRWRGFAWLTLSAVALIAISRKGYWDGRDSSQETNGRGAARRIWRRVILDSPVPCRFLLVVCFLAFSVAMIGLVFDFVFSPLAPKFAASILRFYWFRWNDVTEPLFASILAIGIATGQIKLEGSNGIRWRYIVVILSCLLGGSLLFFRFQKNTSEAIPAGEKQNFVLKTDSAEIQNKQFEDWKSVCRWINLNTERNGLWLTPRRQQSFKWRTQRPELAAWKDMPQNAAAVVQWNARLKDIQKFDSEKRLQPLSEADLNSIVQKYQLRYVLLDLRVEGQKIPRDNLIYPTYPEQNESFAVLEYTPR
jgi:hypothetical protein